jgi:hypothetical protein
MEEEFMPFSKTILVGFILSLMVAVFIPSTKEYVAIYLIPKIVNNEQVQQIPEKAMTILNSKLNEWITDQHKKKE